MFIACASPRTELRTPWTDRAGRPPAGQSFQWLPSAGWTRSWKPSAILPAHLACSLTWDQGTETAAHRSPTVATDIPVRFCDPAGPWQP